MSSAFETAIQAGLAAARQVAGSSITYGRGETTLTVTDAVQGETRKGVIDVGGSEQIVEMCDWMIEVSALSGLSDTPDPEDTITRVIDGTTYTWTVEHRELGQSHWDWSDTSRTQYRIRTRKDGATAYEISKPTGFDISGNELR
jgi:hypothetical protein